MTAWSVLVRDLTNDRTLLELDAERLLPTASVGKLFLLVEVADRLAAGELDPETPVRRDAVPMVADSGIWQHLDLPELPVGDAASLVGAVSDNHATNVLLDLVGLDAVRARSSDLAPKGSALLDQVRSERRPTDPVALSVGCASDLVRLASGLARGEVGSPGASAQVVDWLTVGTDLSMVASAFDLDPLAHTPADGDTWLWSKTGTTRGVRADVGVATRDGHQVAWAALAAWDPDDPEAGSEESAVRPVMKRLRAIGSVARSGLERREGRAA